MTGQWKRKTAARQVVNNVIYSGLGVLTVKLTHRPWALLGSLIKVPKDKNQFSEIESWYDSA